MCALIAEPTHATEHQGLGSPAKGAAATGNSLEISPLPASRRNFRRVFQKILVEACICVKCAQARTSAAHPSHGDRHPYIYAMRLDALLLTAARPLPVAPPSFWMSANIDSPPPLPRRMRRLAAVLRAAPNPRERSLRLLRIGDTLGLAPM